MHPFLQPLDQQFKQRANPVKAEGMKAYMLHQFAFYGLQTPERRKLSKEHFRQYPVNSSKELETIVKECFSLPQREFQYFGIELMGYYKKLWKLSSVRCMEYCLLHKSWWDSVDHVAAHCLGPYFKLFPEQTDAITSRWNRSDNIWLQRSSIMFQKMYKKETDTALLAKYILHCKNSKEFFIQKAIGWALREYSKTDPKWVKSFVKQNKLAPLSMREALKQIDR